MDSRIKELEEFGNQVSNLKASIRESLEGANYAVAIKALSQTKGELIAEGESFLGKQIVKELAK